MTRFSQIYTDVVVAESKIHLQVSDDSAVTRVHSGKYSRIDEKRVYE